MRELLRRLLLRALRKTERPYECYWRDRAFKADAELRQEKAYNAHIRETLRPRRP